MLSVIIPTYNQRGLLTKAIDSVLNQSYQDFEIIVVDDNNPDSPARKKTEILLSNYSSEKRIKYIKHDRNKNGAAARNTGFYASKGEYIAFLDDDDFWEPKKIEKQIAYLQAHTDFDGVYSFIISNGVHDINGFYEGNIVEEYLMNYVALQSSCLLFTRKSIDAIHGFDESFRRHQDYELLIRFFFAGFKMGCVPEYLSHMDTGGGNKMSGEQLNDLKRKSLATFEPYLDKLDEAKHGTKRRIIVANWVKIFESHVGTRRYKLAFKLFVKYFFMDPVTFTRQCWMLLSNHNKRKRQAKQ